MPTTDLNNLRMVHPVDRWDLRASRRNLSRHNGSTLSAVAEFLTDLPQLYAGFDAWLARRLREASRGLADCSIASSGGRIVGVTINTPKSSERHKLSTIFVDPAFRNVGVGTALMRDQWRRWGLMGVRNYYVTVREDRAEGLARLAWQFELQPIAIEMNRYGLGNHEVVLARKGIPTWSVPS